MSRQEHALQRLVLGYAWQCLREQRDKPDVVEYVVLSALQYIFGNIHNDCSDPVKDQVGDNADADVARAKDAYFLKIHIMQRPARTGLHWEASARQALAQCNVFADLSWRLQSFWSRRAARLSRVSI